MAKTRTLPDKYYDKDYETNGIHRVHPCGALQALRSTTPQPTFT